MTDDAWANFIASIDPVALVNEGRYEQVEDKRFRQEQQKLYRMIDRPLRYPRALTQLAEDLAVEPFRYRKARMMLQARRARKRDEQH